VALYEALGYRRISGRIISTDVGQHLALASAIDDIQHLAAVRSLFLPLAEQYPADPAHAAWFVESFSEYLAPSSLRVVGIEAFMSRLSHRLASETGALFEGISLEEVGPILRQSSIINARSGDTIIRRGETASEIFIILDGAVEIGLSDDGAKRVLRTLGKGDVFGELAILGGGRRSADVVALGDVEVWVLTPDFLERLAGENPNLLCRLLRNLCRVLAERLISKDEVAGE
jgi:hypothetical protein